MSAERITDLHGMWIAAYEAGYRDGAGERHSDPGDSAYPPTNHR